RPVEEVGGEGICEPCVASGVARDGGLCSTEHKLAARSAVVLRLQQEVAVVPHVLAELDRVVAGELREHSRKLHRALRAVPRQAIRKPYERTAEAADVHRRDAARPLVNVCTADAELRRRGKTVSG